MYTTEKQIGHTGPFMRTHVTLDPTEPDLRTFVLMRFEIIITTPAAGSIDLSSIVLRGRIYFVCCVVPSGQVYRSPVPTPCA